MNAGEIWVILGGKLDDHAFREFDRAVFRSRDAMEASEKRMGASQSRLSRSMHVMGQAAKVGGLAVGAAALGGVAVMAVQTVKAAESAAHFEAAMRNVNSIAKLSETGLQ